MATEVIGNELAEKLRREDPEQFNTLVRMHLSFVLDRNTDDCDYPEKNKYRPSKWGFGKKTKFLPKGVMEGAPLTQEGICQAYQLIEFLSKECNICQEGLFRRTGQLKRQQELKNLLNSGVPVNLDEGLFSVHDCASVLKNFLAELPEPLLTALHYPIYCQIAEFCGPSPSAVEKSNSSQLRLLHSVQLVFLLLPAENRILLRDVLKLLNHTASFESCNKMSAESLSTMFTPHLLCPRKLTPEEFHANSQAMSGIVAFMIHKGDTLFDIPPKLATDIRAYWAERERRNISGKKDTKQCVCLPSQLNENVCDGTAANTIFTFVDRERTAQENSSNPTEAALAQLYAHVQSLPESSKKRRLIKQFNKENGQGTPLQMSRSKKHHHRSKSLGDSIKKHLFNKSLKRQKASNGSRGYGPLRSLSQEQLNSPLTPASKTKLFNHSLEEEEPASKLLDPIANLPTLNQSLCDSNSAVTRLRHTRLSQASVSNRLVFSQSDNSTCDDANFTNRRAILHNLENQVMGNRSPGSPLCPSKQSSPSSVEESKAHSPVQGLIEHLAPSENGVSPTSNYEGDDSPSCKRRLIIDSAGKCELPPSVASVSLSEVCKQDQDRDSASVNNDPEPPGKLSVDSPALLPVTSSGHLSPTNPLTSPDTDQKVCLVTSTPASQYFARRSSNVVGPFDTRQTSLNHSFLTPIADENNSMSPITRSTQRMSKAMQETMMTPRSRKPVVVLSGSNICHLANVNNWQRQASDKLPGQRAAIAGGIKEESPNVLTPESASGSELCSSHSSLGQHMPSSIEASQHSDCSLTCPFRSYLLSRSVVTASPVDLSFSSRTGDFDTSASNDQCLSADVMSDSLLYCLDGHDPPCSSDSDGKCSENCKDFTEPTEKEMQGCSDQMCITYNEKTALVSDAVSDVHDFRASILNFAPPQGVVNETSL